MHRDELQHRAVCGARLGEGQREAGFPVVLGFGVCEHLGNAPDFWFDSQIAARKTSIDVLALLPLALARTTTKIL